MVIFDGDAVAKGYAADRPNFHMAVVKNIKAQLRLLGRVDSALDVGCGVGLSSIPLLEVARTVFAFDPAEHMIRNAIPCEGVSYLAGRAEDLSFLTDACFDLVTAAGSINWIEQETFLNQLRFHLRKGGYLVVYDGGDAGGSREMQGFQQWYTGTLLTRFPPPPRNPGVIQEDLAGKLGYDKLLSQEYKLQISFDQASYTRFLMTQSFISAAKARESISSDQIIGWLSEELRPHFQGRSVSMDWTVQISCYQLRIAVENRKR